jgi:CheY-like chemotaxis protein/HPt (histidine-containing phosphotransfer) domain-containing protein
MEEKTDGQKPIILAVDDQGVNQELYSLILNKLEYPFILADDGQDALEKAENVSLVFMDIQMPKMNGYEAAKTLRSRGFKKPIVAVTASELPQERETCIQAGMDDLLCKPFKRTDVERMLQKWLGENHISGEAHTEAPGNAFAIKSTGFDLAAVMNNFMNNEEAILPLLSRFIERTRDQIENIPLLEKAGDWETVRRNVHSIKGSAGIVGGFELSAKASVLEKIYKSESKEGAETAYREIHNAFDTFRKEAEEFISSRS